MRNLWRSAALLAAVLSLAGCVHTNSQKTTLSIASPPPNATVLIMDPDVELSLLTTGGAAEPRADWTAAAKTNMTEDVETELTKRGAKIVVFDTKSEPTPHVMQLVHLHEAVGTTVLGNAGVAKLPNKEKVFDWSLGPGVKEIADTYHADYALFIFARGKYASTGRVAVAIVASLFRVTVPLGGQVAFASLVELRTGNVVWIGTAATGESDDMSGAGGAKAVAGALLEDVPIGRKS